jgi:serine/threonine protein kinase
MNGDQYGSKAATPVPGTDTKFRLSFSNYPFMQPIESLGEGGMGGVVKVQITDPNAFAIAYAKDHILAGTMPASLLSIYQDYDLEDKDFRKEVEKRIDSAGADIALRYRIRAEMEKREKKLVQSGYIAAAKMPGDLYSEEITKRFFRESRVLYKMGDHPNITKYIAFLGDMLVMEYFKSKNLSDVLEQEKKLPPERALRAYISVLSALAHAHSIKPSPIIHRDVKPGNILTDGNAGESEAFKITDFGLARPTEGTDEIPSLTVMEGDASKLPLIGTLSYLAPEQISKRAGRIGTWTDMYQLGATLFQLLTGQFLHDKEEYKRRAQEKGGLDSKLITDFMRSQIADMNVPHPHFLRDLEPDLSEHLERLVTGSCLKYPAARFGDKGALNYAASILESKDFLHDEPGKRPNRGDDTKTSIALSYAEAHLHERDARQAEAEEACTKLLKEAEEEADIVARAEILIKVAERIDELPQARYRDVHQKLGTLREELAKREDELDIFKPHRDIALKIRSAYDALKAGVDEEMLYSVPASEIRDNAERLRGRAKTAKERIEKLPGMGVGKDLVDKYASELDSIVSGLDEIGKAYASKKKEFIIAKMNELELIHKVNPNEAAMLIIAIRKAVEKEPGEESLEIVKRLGDYSKAIGVSS